LKNVQENVWNNYSDNTGRPRDSQTISLESLRLIYLIIVFYSLEHIKKI